MAQRLFEQVGEKIRHEIMSGALKPGDRLSSERELAERFGVGRPVVREALRALENAGLLQFRRGNTGGAFICAGDGSALTRSLSDMIVLGAIPIGCLTEARICVLRYTIELASERGTIADFDALDISTNVLADMGPDSDPESIMAEVGRFYVLLGAAAGNAVLTLLIRSLGEIVADIVLKTRPDMWGSVIESRRHLLAKLRARDAAGATEILTRHLLTLQGAIESVPSFSAAPQADRSISILRDPARRKSGAG